MVASPSTERARFLQQGVERLKVQQQENTDGINSNRDTLRAFTAPGCRRRSRSTTTRRVSAHWTCSEPSGRRGGGRGTKGRVRGVETLREAHGSAESVFGF